MTYDEFISEFVDRSEPHTITATEATAALLDLADAHDPWAVSKVAELVRSQLVGDIKKRRKAPHQATYTDSGGRKRRINTMISQPVVDRESGDVVAFQGVLEWDMDAAQLNAYLAKLQRDSREVRDRIEAVRALLDAMQRHPECPTAREAWLADGRSLTEIDLSA